jgi:hypothetical protein
VVEGVNRLSNLKGIPPPSAGVGWGVGCSVGSIDVIGGVRGRGLVGRVGRRVSGAVLTPTSISPEESPGLFAVWSVVGGGRWELVVVCGWWVMEGGWR